VHTQAHNTHHALLHNAKYFFESLHYNSETLTGRSCRIFSKCNKVVDKIWHSSSDRFNVQFRLRHVSPNRRRHPQWFSWSRTPFAISPHATSEQDHNNGPGTFPLKRFDAHGSLTEASSNINHLYQFLTPDSTLNATQKTRTATKHGKITASPYIYTVTSNSRT
jgi:hypothetical protein